jgi:hypothetical protein
MGAPTVVEIGKALTEISVTGRRKRSKGAKERGAGNAATP